MNNVQEFFLLGDQGITANLYCNFTYPYCVICSIFAVTFGSPSICNFMDSRNTNVKLNINNVQEFFLLGDPKITANLYCNFTYPNCGICSIFAVTFGLHATQTF